MENDERYSNCVECHESLPIKVIPYEKSFASHPKAEFWHESENGEVKPCHIYKGTHKKYYFTCPDEKCRHDFYSSIANITYLNRWCPYCANQRLCDNEDCIPCKAKSFASHPKAKFWHKSKNDKDITPRNVSIANGNSYWFTCSDEKCGHDFELRIADITYSNNWCPYCANQRLCDDKDCVPCKAKSFASHPKAKFWHESKNDKDITPRNVSIANGNKYWFTCSDEKCGHDFNMQIYSITCGNQWCPYCANQKLCNDKDCVPCKAKSFDSHPKADLWHKTKNGEVKPRDIFKGTDKKWHFTCPDEKCGHDFEIRIADITYNNWCSYCATPSRILCDDKDCIPCYNKSFASHPKAKFWHKTKNIEKGKYVYPRDIFKGTNKQWHFTCPDEKCGEDFKMAINNITCSNHWCPFCKLKTERKFYKYLLANKDRLNIKDIKRKYRPEWANLRNTHGTYYEYDFYIVLTNGVEIIIEIDGRQHYMQVSNWDSVLLNQIRDRIKENLAADKEINMIRLNQEDVLHDKGNWEDITNKFIMDKYECNNETIIQNSAGGERYISKKVKN
jgi:hypothetical protein